MIDPRQQDVVRTARTALHGLLTGSALALGGMLVMPMAAEAQVNYRAYDVNENTYLDADEYVTYSYDLIDYDNDGIIEATEWDYYTDVWYEPYDFDYDVGYDFDHYDTDGDGFIEVTEYENAWDEEIYRAWDSDNDGIVEMTEYNDVIGAYEPYDTDRLYDW